MYSLIYEASSMITAQELKGRFVTKISPGKTVVWMTSKNDTRLHKLIVKDELGNDATLYSGTIFPNGSFWHTFPSRGKYFVWDVLNQDIGGYVEVGTASGKDFGFLSFH